MRRTRLLLPCFSLACASSSPGAAVDPTSDAVAADADTDQAVPDAATEDVSAPSGDSVEDTTATDEVTGAPCPELASLPALPAGPLVGAAVHDGRLYAATADSLYVSDDAGAHFERVQPTAGFTGSIAAIRAGRGALWLVAGARVVRSTDGLAFEDAGLPPAAVWPPTNLVSDGGEVLAVHGARPYRYDDDAGAFVALFSSDETAPTVSRVATDGAVFLADSLDTGGVVRSADGLSWAPVADLPQWGYQALLVTPAVQLASNLVVLSRSTDGGLTWAPVDAVHGVARLEQVGAKVLAWTGSGLLESVDLGVTWSPSTDTLRATSAEVLEQDGAVLAFSGAGLTRVAQDGTLAPVTPLGGRIDQLFGHEGRVGVQDAQGRLLWSGDEAWSSPSSSGFVGVASVGQRLLAYINQEVFEWKNGGFSPVGAFVTYEAIGRVFGSEDHLFTASGPWMGDSCGTKAPAALESGGLFRWEGGDGWTQAVEGLPVVQQSCSWGPRYPEPRAVHDAGEQLFMATAVHGVYRSTDEGDHWAKVQGLPEGAAAVSFATAGETWALDQNTATLYLALPSGDFEALGVIPDLAPDAHPRAFAATAGALLVGVVDEARHAARQGLWISRDGGAHFTAVSVGGAGVASLRVEGEWLYAGTAGDGVVRLPVQSLSASCDAPR